MLLEYPLLKGILFINVRVKKYLKAKPRKQTTLESHVHPPI